jgi:hypothetical protein
MEKYLGERFVFLEKWLGWLPSVASWDYVIHANAIPGLWVPAIPAGMTN